jgi:hypothetical protein
MSKRKEPNFFGQDIRFVRLVRRSQEEYLQLFEGAAAFPLVGEASPVYLQSKCAPLEIKEFSPDARIVIMLRDPVEMMYSLHAQTVWYGDEDIVDFEKALGAEAARATGRQVPATTGDIERLLYRECALFTRKVERYFRVFGRKSVHVIIYDDFKSDTQDVYHDVLDFLGATRINLSNYAVVNPAKKPRIQYLRRMARAAGNATMLRKIGRGVLPDRLYHRLGRGLLSFEERFNTRPYKRPPLPVTLERRLRESFRAEAQSLSELLDRDLTHWGRYQGEQLEAEVREDA